MAHLTFFNSLEVLSLLHQSPAEDNHSSGAVTDLVILGLGELDHEFRDLVINIHLFEDGCSVIGDGDVTILRHHELVQSLGAQAGLQDLTDRLGRDDVRLDGLGSSHSVHHLFIL